ncbi:diphthine--ammonia ligase [Chryseosolibacter indicus]|uniref:Diphthine--ammonia ligase n=1 Tax=Chryseosolibacter indicus TaxID=2782351 RepID=A0ABS5VUH5_9BACT|nr:diphthine--ammonia ligase [Chryseosolibacter indicus]MBT1705085.1 diphthine--ammonia ligase [Chryseosolibacter indicus]
MDSRRKITISWSGGKDSAFALYRIMLSGEYDVVHLHTVFNSDTRRVGLHGVPESLIERQAEALGIPLVKLYLPAADNHKAYETLMTNFYKQCVHSGITHIMFGDIFLEDLKAYREKLLKNSGLKPVYPIWGLDSYVLLEDFINTGFKTVICAAKQDLFSKEMVGKTINEEFPKALKQGVDPCGENGEFHSFVYSGPIFKHPIPFNYGEVIEQKYSFNSKASDGSVIENQTAFWFQELLD